MKITVLNNTTQVGKLPTGHKHPVKGTFETLTFSSLHELAELFKNLTTHQAITTGIYPDGYNYVPLSDVKNLSKPKYITRSAREASPGHILCIDCDFPAFTSLRGKPLHDFLSKYLPEFFDGAGYITTSSSSYYLKDLDKFHQYYVFKTPADMSQLMLLIDKLFKEHNLLTYSLAKNYLRSYIKTPIDLKLRELQMPIYEMSTQRLQLFNISTPLNIRLHPGNIIETCPLTLPLIHFPTLDLNIKLKHDEAEQDREAKLAQYCIEHNLPASATTTLERGILPAHTILHKANIESGDKELTTTILQEVKNLINLSVPPYTDYKAIGEPEYAERKTANLYYDDPYQLKAYRIADAAHGGGGMEDGGTTYLPQFTYDELDELLMLGKAQNLSKRKMMHIATARSNMDIADISMLANEYKKDCGITLGDLKKLMTQSSHVDMPLLEEEIQDISDENIASLLASIEGARIDIPNNIKTMIKEGIDLHKLFQATNLETLREIVLRYGNDIITKPGPKNNYLHTTKSKAVKALAQVYPLTNISPKANELAMDSMIDVFTANRNIETMVYKSSLFGEKLNFSDNRMEITYQLARPNFSNIPDVHKTILDQMSNTQLQELSEIYQQESIGDIWQYVAELTYIKKVYPELKKDFLWLHLMSDAGKTYNMDIAHSMVGVAKTNLNQLLEQASKVKPQAVARAGFMFHDEVKHFNHNWNELGNMHTINGMHSNGTLTQLPLKILASAENTMDKLTKQQANRLMLYRSKAKDFKAIVNPKDVAAFGAMTHKFIYDKFAQYYDFYTSMAEHKAVSHAIKRGSILGTQLTSPDTQVTDDVIKDMLKAFFTEEWIDNQGILPEWSPIKGIVKHMEVIGHELWINFKATASLPKVIEIIFKQSTSSIESRAMNYEALNMSWNDIGAITFKTQTAKGSQKHGWYGYVLKIPFKQKEI